MFIRIKSVKGKKYAYLVENKWQKADSCWKILKTKPHLAPYRAGKFFEKNKKEMSCRQKVVEYLGRVHEFTMPEKGFNNKLDKSYSNSIKKIILWHLGKCGFKRQGSQMTNEFMTFDMNLLELRNIRTNSGAVIKTYDGHICNYTLKRLNEFDGLGYDEEVGKKLANALVRAGLNISKERFIELFEKVFREAR